jgi:hypothetical protein
MTTKYWLKILLGIALIFGIGMVAVQGINAGKAKAEEWAASSSSFTVPLFGMPFRLDGHELGSVQRVKIERDAPRSVSGFHFAIDLNDASALEKLATCDITLEDPENIDEHSAFICASDDSGAVEMVSFGTIVFQPSNQTHVLNVPATFRDEIIAAAHSSDESDTAGIKSDHSVGKLTLDLNGKELIRISGDSAGGFIKITDPATGKPIVEINAGP